MACRENLGGTITRQLRNFTSREMGQKSKAKKIRDEGRTMAERYPAYLLVASTRDTRFV